MTIKGKVYGTGGFMLGTGLLYLDYIIIRAVGAVGGWIADIIGATGSAHTGITLIAYIPLLGLIAMVLFGAGLSFKLGIDLFREY